MKNKIRKFIWKLFGLDKEFKEQNERLNEVLENTLKAVDAVDKHQNFLGDKQQETHRLLLQTRQLINVGIDIGVPPYRDSSWAVICVKGKTEGMDIIKFMDLGYEDAKHLREILKGFEGCNRVIDKTSRFKNFF